MRLNKHLQGFFQVDHSTNKASHLSKNLNHTHQYQYRYFKSYPEKIYFWKKLRVMNVSKDHFFLIKKKILFSNKKEYRLEIVI